MKRLSILLLLVIANIASANDIIYTACNSFYEDLLHIPHDNLVMNTGRLYSLFDNDAFLGCEVLLNSDQKLLENGSSDLPSFRATKGSQLYEYGWRDDHRYLADGPGSGAYGIVNDRILCRISWDQHAWIDDPIDSIEQSDVIKMVIQCMKIPLSNNNK